MQKTEGGDGQHIARLSEATIEFLGFCLRSVVMSMKKHLGMVNGECFTGQRTTAMKR